MNWDIIATIGGMLGGAETIKYLFNRRINKRKEAATATSMELANKEKKEDISQKHVAFLQQQLQEQSARCDVLYETNSKLMEKNTELLIANGEKDVALAAAEHARCNMNDCADRQPPKRYAQRNYKPKKITENENKQQGDSANQEA